MKVAVRLDEQQSLEVDLFHLNGIESYYKFMQEKNNQHMLCREWREISHWVSTATV